MGISFIVADALEHVPEKRCFTVKTSCSLLTWRVSRSGGHLPPISVRVNAGTGAVTGLPREKFQRGDEKMNDAAKDCSARLTA
jgi:hypothetical protein